MMTIEQQLQTVIHETNILREMIAIFSDWNYPDIEWVLHNLDQSIEWLIVLQGVMNEKSQN